MTIKTRRSALAWLAPTLVVCVLLLPGIHGREEPGALDVHYLEIVTPDRDATCKLLEQVHGVRFGDPVAAFGNARTARLAGGGTLGVRAPMHEAEAPVVRPYLLVDDIEAAVEAAAAAGGEIAMPPTETVDDGRFSIYFHGGIQHGVWSRSAQRAGEGREPR